MKKILHLKSKILHRNQGFTLIELLVVVAIIGLLSGVLFASFTTIQKRARDGQRKTDLRTIQHALELWRTDVGAYPDTSVISALACNGSLINSGITYLQKLPCDAYGTAWWNSGRYYYTGGNSSYTIVACIENTNDSDPNIAGSASLPAGAPTTGCPSNKWYILTNP